MTTTYLAVCACGNVLNAARPIDKKCRCGNYIPAGYFERKNEKRYVEITGFRGEKIKCYQQD